VETPGGAAVASAVSAVKAAASSRIGLDDVDADRATKKQQVNVA
jgi:hypothetical protein